MTDREEREKVIEILQKEKKTALHDNRWAFDYAIASIKTDLRYDLLYEETSEQADKQADKPTTKNNLGVEKIIDEIEKEFEKVDIPIMDKLTLFAKVQNSLYKCAELRNSKILTDSITENCIACKYDEIEESDGKHCKKCLAGDSQFEVDKEFVQPTAKNDLALIHTEGLDEGIRCAMCTNSMKSDRGCDGSCVVNNAMYKKVMDVIENHIVDTDKMIESTTKNNLGVECISRAQAQTEMEMNASRYTIAKERCGMGQVEWSDQLIKVSDAVDIIRHLSPVTPQFSSELDKNSKRILASWIVYQDQMF